MSTDALPEQASPVEVGPAQAGPEQATTTTVATPPVQNQPVQDETQQDAAPPAAPQAPSAEDVDEHEDSLESRTAARLHQLVVSGADKLPGEAGSTVSKLAVAMLSFGSQVASKDQEKPTNALVGDAVALYKSLDDDDADKQRGALESALERFTTSALGGKERSQVLEVAEEAMGLWGRLRGTTSDLAKSDAAESMRSLSSALRKDGRHDEADETEHEVKRLES